MKFWLENTQKMIIYHENYYYFWWIIKLHKPKLDYNKVRLKIVFVVTFLASIKFFLCNITNSPTQTGFKKEEIMIAAEQAQKLPFIQTRGIILQYLGYLKLKVILKLNNIYKIKKNSDLLGYTIITWNLTNNQNNKQGQQQQ